MLPGETKFSKAISRELYVELKLGRTMLRSCLSILEVRRAKKHPHQDDKMAFRVGHALCAKACKTYRSILQLAIIGATHDIDILSRTLFETLTAAVFVLRSEVALGIKGFQDDQLTSDLRARIYAATYSISQYNDFLSLKDDKQLNRAIINKVNVDRLREEAETAQDDIGTFWAERIAKQPRTYSGLSLRGLTSRLDPDLSKWYVVVYGLQSKPVHAVDAIHHVMIDSTTGGMRVKWHATIDKVRDALIFSSTLLLKCVWELDERFDFEAASDDDYPTTRAELQMFVNAIGLLQEEHFPPETIERRSQ